MTGGGRGKLEGVKKKGEKKRGMWNGQRQAVIAVNSSY